MHPVRLRNNPTITAFVCFQKFRDTFKAFCLLLLSEHMRYPSSANLSQVQTLFQNCLHTAFWYASTTSYIFDIQSCILFDHNLYSSDVSFGNRGFRPSRTGIIFNRKFPSFKSFNLPKNGVWSWYTNLITKVPVSTQRGTKVESTLIQPFFNVVCLMGYLIMVVNGL